MRLRPLPGAFACNPAPGGWRRPPPVTSRPRPAPRAAPGPRPRRRGRAPGPAPRLAAPRERATPTCREPMAARLASPSARAARPRCSFEKPLIPAPAAPGPAPGPAAAPAAPPGGRAEREGDREQGSLDKGTAGVNERQDSQDVLVFLRNPKREGKSPRGEKQSGWLTFTLPRAPPAQQPQTRVWSGGGHGEQRKGGSEGARGEVCRPAARARGARGTPSSDFSPHSLPFPPRRPGSGPALWRVPKRGWGRVRVHAALSGGVGKGPSLLALPPSHQSGPVTEEAAGRTLSPERGR